MHNCLNIYFFANFDLLWTLLGDICGKKRKQGQRNPQIDGLKGR